MLAYGARSAVMNLSSGRLRDPEFCIWDPEICIWDPEISARDPEISARDPEISGSEVESGQFWVNSEVGYCK